MSSAALGSFQLRCLSRLLVHTVPMVKTIEDARPIYFSFSFGSKDQLEYSTSARSWKLLFRFHYLISFCFYFLSSFFFCFYLFMFISFNCLHIWLFIFSGFSFIFLLILLSYSRHFSFFLFLIKFIIGCAVGEMNIGYKSDIWVRNPVEFFTFKCAQIPLGKNINLFFS